MANSKPTTRFRFWLWLIALVGVIVPRRLRADWRQEWEAELRYRETLLTEWDKLDQRGKLALIWHSAGAFMDALWLQPRRLEDEMFQDLRYGARMLLKSPGFTAAAVLSLALGIGANSAIFSVVNAVLLRPLPYDRPDQIMKLWTTQPQNRASRIPFSAPNFVDLKAQNQVFSDMAVYRGWQFILTGAGEPLRVFGHRVSAGFFPVLGVKPLLGRGFLYEEDKPGNDGVVVISYGLWQSHFAADPDIIGRSLTIDDQSRTVVGVTPPGFRFESQENALWVPMAFMPADLNRRLSNTFVIARLKPGVAPEQAQAEMNSIAARLETSHPAENKGKGISVTRLRDDVVGDIRSALLVLLGAVGFVLLIACANVANLQLTRALGRRRELAVRMALGATRLRLIRQLITESAILSLLGGGLGLLFSSLGLRLLTGLATDRMPRVEEAVIDGSVLGFTFILSILTALLFGLIPAFQASKPVNDTLKEGVASGVSLRRQRLRSAFVIAEVALSIVLLAGAGLMIKSFLRLQQVNPGFNPERLLTLETYLPPARYPRPQQQAAFYQQVEQRLAAVPGVQSVGANIGPPFTGAGIGFSFEIEGRAAASPSSQLVASYRAISPGYFQTMGVALLKGRDFTDGDNREAPGVAIINQSFARSFFPKEDPIGKRLDIGDGYNHMREIVGVVGDTKGASLKEPAPAEMYVVYMQRPWQWIRYAVRTSAEPESLASAIRAAVWSVDKDIPVNDLKTMERLIAETTTEPRFYLILLSVFAAVALILSAVGVYGVISYTITQRRHEIGVRMALGARATDVLKLVVGQGMALALAGVALGLAGAFALTRTLTTLLFTVEPTDPAVFAAIALMIIGVALLASLIPARRAVKVNPGVALRQE
jgi:putative ABC transport system permease protein